jgi:hypothetical protein
MDKKVEVLLGLAVVLVILFMAYRYCYLDSFLPTSWKYGKCTTSSFVGVYGGNSAMSNCHKWDKTGTRSTFNRCTYM